MFFPKLRAHAKWVFVLLAIVFAGGFIFLGVGSGSAGLGDIFSNWNDFFSSSSGSSAQADDARNKIKDNPKDYAAYKDLAAAQASDGKLDEAIATLQQLRSVNPKDADGAQQLAGLYLRKADDARTEAQAIQASVALVSPTDFSPTATSKLGEAYQTLNDPIVAAVQGQVNEKLNTAYSKMTTAFSQAVTAYKDVARLTPSDPSIQFALAQTAEQAADTKTALAAYKRFLVLAPEDPTAPAIRQRIKQLEQQGGTSVSAGG